MTFWYCGIAWIALCFFTFVAAYNWYLPGYNVRKMLMGISGEDQMYSRRRQGKFLMIYSGIMGAVLIFIFGVLSLIEVNKVEYVPVNEVAIIQIPKQNKIVIIVDKKHRYEKKLENFKYLDRSYDRSCIVRTVTYNLYGDDISWLNGNRLVIFSPDDCGEFLKKRCKDAIK